MGILINSLNGFPHSPLGNVGMQIDKDGTAEDIFNHVIEWFSRYDTLEKLKDGCAKKFSTVVCTAILEQLNGLA